MPSFLKLDYNFESRSGIKNQLLTLLFLSFSFLKKNYKLQNIIGIIRVSSEFINSRGHCVMLSVQFLQSNSYKKLRILLALFPHSIGKLIAYALL